MQWKYIAIFLFGTIAGAIDGGLNGQSWNRPICYSGIIIDFVIFPALFIGLALTIRSLKELAKLIIVSQIGWIISCTNLQMVF